MSITTVHNSFIVANPQKFIKTSIQIAVISVLITSVSQPVSAKRIVNLNQQQTTLQPVNEQLKVHQPKIQLAILLDTSGSMDGLIDQTRNQLWQVVNEFSSAKQQGVKPILEVAVFEYGNDNNPAAAGFVRKLNSFTRELDKVSEGLFSLTTNGGSEYCGFAIKTAVENLQWSSYNSDIKTIFIAGNEPFTQGPVAYQSALNLAQLKGISVNTIHAGNYQTGVEGGWRTGAQLAGGDYMSIDTNQKVVHVIAPQDKKIAALNARLNETYVPFGSEGEESSKRQMEQDKLSSNISSGLLAKRAKSKSSSFYNNAKWDLVDAMEEGSVDASSLADMNKESLPEAMKTMSTKQKQDYVIEKANQRKEIKHEITALSKIRDQFVAEEKRKIIAAAPSISDALTNSVKKQAKQKGFVFEK